MSRPALPRASSAMSGFFFCGSIDEPVLYASARRRNPNSSRRPQHDLLAEARQVHLGERGDEQRLGHEVAVGHRVERVVERTARSRARSRSRRDRAAGSIRRARRRRAATRRRARRQSRQRSTSRAKRPEVREEVVREQHRLRALQVRVARAGTRRRRSSARRSSTSGARDARGDCRVPSRRRNRRSSVATWSLRLRPVCSFAPALPGELGDPPLDRGVDVLVGRHELERARRRARPRPRRARSMTTARSSSVSRPTRGEHRDVRARARDVVGREAPVERQALGEREQLVGRAVGETAVPERLADASAPARIASVIASPGPGGATTSPPTGPTAARTLAVLVTERVGGVVGGEVVVVEAVGGAPADREQRPGFEPQPHLAGDVLAASARRTRRAPHQRRVPQAVVDQLGVARSRAAPSPARGRARG